MFNLDTQVSSIVVPESLGYIPRYGHVYKEGFLFTSDGDHRLYFWQSSQITTFAGGCESGSRDGTAQFARFYELSAISVEFDHVVYLSDYATGSIRMITTLKNTSSFLEAVGKLATAFSVHEKHQNYDTKTMDEAIALVTQCNNTLQANEEIIRQKHRNLPKSLNGPEGNISAKTMKSICLLLWGLSKLKSNLDEFGFDSINLLSCMTLDIEHLHSTVNFKHGVQSMLQYARSFSSSIKESVKALTNWSVFYYTSNQARWYPPPEGGLKLNELRFPKPTEPRQMEDDKKVMMREWASLNGAVVRQRSVRQETTMAKAGTLPEGSYDVELVPNNTTIPDSEGNDDEIVHYDDDESDSDIEDSTEFSQTHLQTNMNSLATLQTNEVGLETSFLLGGCSRYGRTVRFNSRFT